MHRDNPDIPVGEFVDAIAKEIAAGRIGIWGGSNWSIERFDEACTYAKENCLTAPTVLNNNLSLAQMIKPVWPGCVTSNNPETLAHLRKNNVVHVSWSSQARGFFLPEELRNRLPEATRPDVCFGGSDNEIRRARAEELATKYGVSAHNIATAWLALTRHTKICENGETPQGCVTNFEPGLTRMHHLKFVLVE